MDQAITVILVEDFSVILKCCLTELNQNLIARFPTILEVISSGHNFDTDTVHKIQVHGPVFIRKALLPIGSLSEEASEARNMHFR